MKTSPTPGQILPADYETRVYAGVLGKLIGVYLGRPFEQWSHERIAQRWGEIRRYVHQDQKVPLIVTDDDITGTFTFVRALKDHQVGAKLSSRQIGESWLNYIAENRHILWWGGMGNSTEHTAYLRLKGGMSAPESGSMQTNGAAVAEEIGAQIFIDGWALVSPNQPEQAARLAREAARVSHDGEAVHGAILIAVMEALAFSEQDIDRLLDAGLSYLPQGCLVAQMIADVRKWTQADQDWRKTLARIIDVYGYERFGTNCPLVSNLAILLLALLYGAGDFDESMMIVNTAGYDTDCNAGNLGCLLGIRNGLGTFRTGFDWRTPINDRLYLPAADGHWGMMDAANLSLRLVNMGRELVGAEPLSPKKGARYAFSLPGSTHGFAPSELCPLDTRLTPTGGGIILHVLAKSLRNDAEVNTFTPPEGLSMTGYAASATPTLYPGQALMMSVRAGRDNSSPVSVRPFIRAYGGGFSGRELVLVEGPAVSLKPNEFREISWCIPETQGAPIAKAGLSLEGESGAELVLERMHWTGTPALHLVRPDCIKVDGDKPNPWAASFVNGLDHFHIQSSASFHLTHNLGTGILHTGAEDWRDLRVKATLRPFLAARFGLALRVQGLERWYGFLLRDDQRATLVRRCHGEHELATTGFAWEIRQPVELIFSITGNNLQAWANGKLILEAQDTEAGLEHGGGGFLLAGGRITANGLDIGPPAEG